MKKTAKKMSDMGSIKSLEPGESKSFPIAKLYSIKTNASLINATRGEASLSTKIDRANGVIIVSRKA